MKWGEIKSEHHLKWGHVSTKAPGIGPDNRGPFVGIIHCPTDGVIPYLQVQDKVHTFAEWYDVVLA